MLFLYWKILPYKMAAVEQETYGNKLAPYVVYSKATPHTHSAKCTSIQSMAWEVGLQHCSTDIHSTRALIDNECVSG